MSGISAGTGDPIVTQSSQSLASIPLQVLASWYFFEEQVSRTDVFAAVLGVTSCIAFTVTAVPSRHYSESDILDYLQDFAFLALTAILAALSVISFKILPRFDIHWSDQYIPPIAIVYAYTGILLMTYGGLALCVAMKLLANDARACLASALFWASVIVMVACVLASANYIQHALILADALVVFLLCALMSPLFNNLIGTILFQQDRWQLWYLFTLLIVALFSATYHPMKDQKSEADIPETDEQCPQVLVHPMSPKSLNTI